MGEFIFDWEWAEAAHRVGIQYYPKMLVGVPFTPVTGPRFLTTQDEDRKALIRLMGQALAKVAADNKISSVHVNFCLVEEREALEEVGFFARAGLQFHWQNQNFHTFDDYLGSFRSDRRNKIKQSDGSHSKGIVIRAFEGADLTRTQMRTMFRLYKGHVDRHYYGRQYLTAEFFDEVHRRLRRTFVDVGRAREIIAGTFNVRDGQRCTAAIGALSKATFPAFQRLLLLRHRALHTYGFGAFEAGLAAVSSSLESGPGAHRERPTLSTESSGGR